MKKHEPKQEKRLENILPAVAGVVLVAALVLTFVSRDPADSADAQESPADAPEAV